MSFLSFFFCFACSVVGMVVVVVLVSMATACFTCGSRQTSWEMKQLEKTSKWILSEQQKRETLSYRIGRRDGTNNERVNIEIKNCEKYF